MKKSTQEKSLITINNESIFYKIKRFLKNIFHRNKAIVNTYDMDESKNINEDTVKENESFKEYIKNIEDEETKLLKLQNQYRSGEIKEEELTQEQVKSLCALYDKQIANLKKSNEIRKQKLLEYRKRLQTEN